MGFRIWTYLCTPAAHRGFILNQKVEYYGEIVKYSDTFKRLECENIYRYVKSDLNSSFIAGWCFDSLAIKDKIINNKISKKNFFVRLHILLVDFI